MANEKKSILKEALTDYQQIMEAADANAKKKLAEEFPDKFTNLLKEEIHKNKKSKESSYKKLDEGKESEEDKTDLNKESVMKKDVKETKKVEENVGDGKPFAEKPKAGDVQKVEETAGDGKPFGEKAKGVQKVEEDVHITDTVGKGDPFKEKAKKADKIEEGIGNSKPFDETAKRTLQTEEFDITDMDADNVDSALNGAGDEDEIITMEQIEEEIASMEGLGEELEGIESSSPSYMEKDNKGIAYDQLIAMRNQLDEMISSLGQPVAEMHAPGENTFGDTTQINSLHNQGPTKKLVDETEITDDDIEAVLGGASEQPVEESMGVSYSAGTITPGKLGNHEGTHGRFRQGVDESQKKVTGLIKENKDLTKKLNEVKKYKQSVTTLLEQYKSAIEKYRTQLKEMAVFNTNLAHVNNLLVNESLALTQDDKIKIINGFKSVDSITESQKKYKTFLNEMKESKKTLTESIEERVTTSIQPSSKQKLDEVVEKTAYANDEHINKMKKLIEYAERRGNKKII